MANGRVIRVDGRIVLATAYGQNPACLGADLALLESPTPANIVKAARKWEITHAVEDYKGSIREHVPEARFADYAPDSEIFSVRTDTVLTNQYQIPEIRLKTRGYYVIHGDDHGTIDLHGYLEEMGLQRGTEEAGFVRKAEIRRKYMDIAKALLPLVADEKDEEKILGEMEALDFYGSLHHMFYMLDVDMAAEYNIRFPDGAPDFMAEKGFILPHVRKLLGECRKNIQALHSPSLKQTVSTKIADIEKILQGMERCERVEDWEDLMKRVASLEEFEEARKESKLLAMGLDPDWIKTYFDVRGSPDLEALRRKHMK